jgi:hypothetical protein
VISSGKITLKSDPLHEETEEPAEAGDADSIELDF